MDTISGWDIYWITRLGSFGALFGILAGVILVGALVISFAVSLENGVSAWTSREMAARMDANKAKWWRILKCWFLPAGLGFALLSAAMPSTREMAAIIVIPKLANSETVQGVGEDIVGLAKLWIEELKPEPEK